jgi:mannitol-specific phosphotransferase system IIBC component
MTKFICDHPAIAIQLISILSLGFLSSMAATAALIRFVYNKDIQAQTKAINELKESQIKIVTDLKNTIDHAIKDHYDCQISLPKRFLSREDFKEIMMSRDKDRKEEWGEFLAEFKNFTSHFWKHVHDSNGKVERM